MNLTTSTLKTMFFQVFDTVLTAHSTVYVSGPIETGRLFYESLVNDGAATPQVRLINQQRLHQFANHLRQRLQRPVLDPTPLAVPGWNGQDYITFYLEVIQQYICESWFIAGWEYSTGATAEFWFCIEHHVPCYAETGEPLTAEHGNHLIGRAAAYVESLGLDSTLLRSRIH
ncbi:MAG: hypothetical protein HC837_11565 [Chloroflexaceae bacterium]|nr:hypothetical protein [Chloroflexaceae bacterium]